MPPAGDSAAGGPERPGAEVVAETDDQRRRVAAACPAALTGRTTGGRRRRGGGGDGAGRATGDVVGPGSGAALSGRGGRLLGAQPASATGPAAPAARRRGRRGARRRGDGSVLPGRSATTERRRWRTSGANDTRSRSVTGCPVRARMAECGERPVPSEVAHVPAGRSQRRRRPGPAGPDSRSSSRSCSDSPPHTPYGSRAARAWAAALGQRPGRWRRRALAAASRLRAGGRARPRGGRTARCPCRGRRRGAATPRGPTGGRGGARCRS